MYPVNEIRTIYPCRLNKEIGSKFCVSSQVQQEIAEEGWKTNQLKHSKYDNKDDNSPNILNDENYHASSKKIQTSSFNKSCIMIYLIWWVTYEKMYCYNPIFKTFFSGNFCSWYISK